MKPVQVDNINAHGWQRILNTSQSEGFGMVKRLLTDFRAGTNRFNSSGEALFVYLSGNSVIGVAGLNKEPDNSILRAGRIRRLYVIPDFRGKGLGRNLVDQITAMARPNFEIITVNAGNLAARGFYECLGFVPVEHPNITHKKILSDNINLHSEPSTP